MDGGLFFHDKDYVLNICSPHRHLLIGSCDAGFDHEGRKAVSGATISMNGAAIAVVARRQSTTSQQTAEAQVKTPMRVKATALVPWEGSATERDTFVYDVHGGPRLVDKDKSILGVCDP